MLLLLLLLLLLLSAALLLGVLDARVDAAHRRLGSSSAAIEPACGASCCMIALNACAFW
jgi:hypothetical protein